MLTGLAEIAPGAKRAIVLQDSAQFELEAAMEVAVRMLTGNPKGYFLMVEWDTHTDNLRRGLDRMVATWRTPTSSA